MLYICGFFLKRMIERYEILLFINRFCKRFSKDLKNCMQIYKWMYKFRKYVYIKSNFVKKVWDNDRLLFKDISS